MLIISEPGKVVALILARTKKATICSTYTLNDNSGIISEPGKVRVIMRDGEPWFVASDVATALGYDNPQKAIIDHCKRAEILKGSDSLPLTTSPRGINIILEQDVYRLIMRSNLPGAERFQDWVCEEVVPSIRKQGVYAPQTAPQIAMPNFADPAAAARAWAAKNANKITQPNESFGWPETMARTEGARGSNPFGLPLLGRMIKGVGISGHPWRRSTSLLMMFRAVTAL